MPKGLLQESPSLNHTGHRPAASRSHVDHRYCHMHYISHACAATVAATVAAAFGAVVYDDPQGQHGLFFPPGSFLGSPFLNKGEIILRMKS